jgi:uncharacterized protein YndB with AHSA1/START domain
METTSKNKNAIVKDLNEKSILVSREFEAPIADVWRAYTESELLEQWWAPKPWRAETKQMNFKPGGYWLYAMVGPEGEKHWARMDYLAIDLYKSFDIQDSFSDENGVINRDLPVSKGKSTFTKTAKGTRVEFKLTYSTEEQLQKIVEMGFEQGITMCMDQLDELFKKKFVK